MKHLILWASILVMGTGLALFWEKVSIARTLIDIDVSPVYVNIIFCLLGAYLFGTRLYALIGQLFK